MRQKSKIMIFYIILCPQISSAVKRAEVFAGAVVGTLFVHAKGIPGGRTVDLFLRHVVHAHGDPEHGGQSDQISTDVAVVEGSVVGAPVGHDAVHVGESTLAGQIGNKPGGGPGGIGALVEHIVNFSRQLSGVTFSDLDHRTDSFDRL